MVSAAAALLCVLAAGDPAQGADPGGPRVLSLEAFGGLYRSDYSTLGGTTRTFTGGQLSAAAPLAGRLRLRLDLLGGRFGTSELVGSGALRAYAWVGRHLVGASWGHTELEGGIRSDTFAVHGEVEEEPWLRVTGSVGIERKNFGDDLLFWELFLRLYPSARWVASAGVSYAVAEVKQTRADVVLRGEWIALAAKAASAALYVQYGGNLYTKVSAGLVVYLDGRPPAERERLDGLTSARFK